MAYRTLRFQLLLFVCFAAVLNPAHGGTPREWTVMVYMNAKNNLEPHALENFHSMASIGSSPSVAVVAELGRPSKTRYTKADGNWSGVYRFYVSKGLKPLPERAVDKPAEGADIPDMGDPRTLRNFIAWAKKTYPARRYMLVIWNHGQGWRLQLGRTNTNRLAIDGAHEAHAPELTAAGPPVGGFRAVSADDDTGSILYNKEVQNVIQSEFADKQLDLLGFDACLMAMLETAYGLAPSTKVMVASEELEPGAGWRYSYWLAPLVANPAMGAESLGTHVVEAYRKHYGDEYETTLSAIRLKDIRAFSQELSSLSDQIRSQESELQALRRARARLRSYGDSELPPLRTSVDLLALLRLYEGESKNQELRQRSKELRQKLKATIISNYSSVRSAAPPDGMPYGSEGIAIYLPEDADAFYKDHYHAGYLKNNTDLPVDFVKNERWAELIYSVLDIKPQ